jgi:hypothetical protein
MASTYHIELFVPPEDSADNRLTSDRGSRWMHFEGLMPDGLRI